LADLAPGPRLRGPERAQMRHLHGAVAPNGRRAGVARPGWETRLAASRKSNRRRAPPGIPLRRCPYGRGRRLDLRLKDPGVVASSLQPRAGSCQRGPMPGHGPCRWRGRGRRTARPRRHHPGRSRGTAVDQPSRACRRSHCPCRWRGRGRRPARPRRHHPGRSRGTAVDQPSRACRRSHRPNRRPGRGRRTARRRSHRRGGVRGTAVDQPSRACRRSHRPSRRPGQSRRTARRRPRRRGRVRRPAARQRVMWDTLPSRRDDGTWPGSWTALGRQVRGCADIPRVVDRPGPSSPGMSGHPPACGPPWAVKSGDVRTSSGLWAVWRRQLLVPGRETGSSSAPRPSPPRMQEVASRACCRRSHRRRRRRPGPPASLVPAPDCRPNRPESPDNPGFESRGCQGGAPATPHPSTPPEPPQRGGRLPRWGEARRLGGSCGTDPPSGDRPG